MSIPILLRVAVCDAWVENKMKKYMLFVIMFLYNTKNTYSTKL